MARCPLCKKKIDHLEYEEEKTAFCSVSVVDDRLLYDTTIEAETDVKYECPECEMVIAISEDAAKIILGVE